MSFGFSIGDIVKLIELTTHTYASWKHACGTYATITHNLNALCTLLVRIDAEVQSPVSLIFNNGNDLQHWESLSESCYDVVTELADILNKYRSLSTSRAKNWERIRLGNKDIAGLNSRLLIKIDSVSAFATAMGISSQGRIENVLFPELMRKLDSINERFRKETSSVCTLTTYESDDKDVWRDYRREMIRAGVKSRDIHRYKYALKTYLLRLKCEGLADEEGDMHEDGTMGEERAMGEETGIDEETGVHEETGIVEGGIDKQEIGDTNLESADLTDKTPAKVFPPQDAINSKAKNIS